LIPVILKLNKPPADKKNRNQFVMSKTIKIALPKGSLQDPTIKLLEQAGFNVYMSDRGLRPSSNDSELDIYLIRAQEIGRYISEGFIDCGITGLDWASSFEENLVDLAELPYSRSTVRPTKWVLVVPEDSPIQSVQDLEGKRIATEGVEITTNYLKKHGVNAHVEFSWGATEVKVPDLVDAIVDVTETGSSIRANNLRIVDTLLTSFPHFYGSKESYSDEWKKGKMDRMVLMIKAALEARGKVGLKMNLPEKSLQEVVEKLPSLRRPTISRLSEEGWVAIEIIIEDKVARHLIPDLKELGAEGIIEYPISKIVL
jgi:ATP phosphoribosyltransferase